MLWPARYQRFSRPTVQAVTEQTEHYINGCKIYGRNCVKSSWVRGHIASFEEGVLSTDKFGAVQIFKIISENAKFLYSIFWELKILYRRTGHR